MAGGLRVCGAAYVLESESTLAQTKARETMRETSVLVVARANRGKAQSLTDLAELLQVVHADIVAGQVQHRVLERAGVPVREDEPVAVGPAAAVTCAERRTEALRFGMWRHDGQTAAHGVAAWLDGARRQGGGLDSQRGADCF